MVRYLLSAIRHNPPAPPHYCDYCNTIYLFCHTLDCKRSGLVTALHNNLCYEVADMAGKDFNSSHVRDDPLNFTGCAVKRTKENPARTTGTTALEKSPPL